MSETIKVKLYYGGFMDASDRTSVYRGGSVKEGLVVDPDYLTWSIFDDFIQDLDLGGSLVQQLWYKLPNEDMETVRAIFELSSDAELMKLAREASKVGEVDIFVEQVVVPPVGKSARGKDIVIDSSVNDNSGGAEDREDADNGCEKDGKGNDNAENHGSKKGRESDGYYSSDDDGDIADDEGGAQEEVGDEVIEEGGDDVRFKTFMDEIHNGFTDAPGKEGARNVEHVHVANDYVFDEEEFERQCRDGENPEPAVETDEEWHGFNRKEREISRKVYSKEKPPYLWLMQTFKSGEEIKDQLLRYVLKTNFDVKLCRWDSDKLAAICTKKECKWKIYCSVEKPKGKWMVKTYVDKHNHHLKSSKARMLKRGTVAMLFKDEAKRRPSIKWTDIKDEIMMRYNLNVSKWICQKARRLALDMVIQSQKEQFAKLWDYEGEMKRSNNASTEIVTIPRHDGKQVFDRFYISFEQLRESWKRNCRPVIGLDGAFMKWELKGEILAATGRDADNRIFPFAWAIVRVEDNASWAWFVGKLKTELELGLGKGYTFISDKQKGLINAISDLLPEAEHRHCARHIFANWKKVYGMSEYENYFWAVAKSSAAGIYQYNMRVLKEFDPYAHDDLLKTEPKTWCKAFFTPQSRCDDVCNNLSESFNRTIKEARKLPLIDMLEEIRRLALKRITRRRILTSKCESKFPPNIMDIFEQNRTNSEACTVLQSSENSFEVVDANGSYEVNILYKHCACNEWDVSGIPCSHAIHVITDLNRDPEDYVDECYLTSKWHDTYRNNIRPVNGDLLWDKLERDPIQIPEKRRMPGRPKNFDRIKEAHESSTNPTKATREGRIVTCSNCKVAGHNISTCTRAPAMETGLKRKRGKPRKTTDNDPWSVQNAPRRRNVISTQPATISTSHGATFTQPDVDMHPSSAPPSTSASRGRSRGSGRPRGRPRGRGRGRTLEPPIPRGYGCYISPFTGQVFNVWGSTATKISGPPPSP